MPTDNQPPVDPNPQTPAPTITNPPPVEPENPTEKRIKALSGKVETTAKERDEAIAKADAATKLAQFSESFIDIVAANPAAKDFKEQIKEKVMGGYSPQDATFAVLGAAGKLGNQQPVAPMTGNSAPTAIFNQGQKAPAEMSREELRGALLEAQKRGDFFLS